MNVLYKVFSFLSSTILIVSQALGLTNINSTPNSNNENNVNVEENALSTASPTSSPASGRKLISKPISDKAYNAAVLMMAIANKSERDELIKMSPTGDINEAIKNLAKILDENPKILSAFIQSINESQAKSTKQSPTASDDSINTVNNIINNNPVSESQPEYSPYANNNFQSTAPVVKNHEPSKINVFSGNSTCTNMGGTTFCDDAYYNQMGNTKYGSNGSTYNQMGNYIYGNDGSSYSKMGNTTFKNDGTYYNQMGNTTFGSDGSIYTKLDNTTFKTPGY